MKKLLLSLLCMAGALSPFALSAQETVTIVPGDFTKVSYADNNGTHTATSSATREFGYYTYQVYQNSDSQMQWQKNYGYLYNVTSLGAIQKIEITSDTNNLTVYECATAASGTNYEGTALTPSVSETVYTYTFTGANNYFYIKTGTMSKTTEVKIYFAAGGSSDEPSLYAVPSSLNFGNVMVGYHISKPVIVTAANLPDGVVPTYTCEDPNLRVDGELTAEGGDLIVTLVTTAAASVNATITITAGELSAEVAVTGTVVELIGSGDGTIDSPYDVTRACQIVEYGWCTEENVYVTGLISSITGIDVTNYYNATYNISVDGAQTGVQLMAFRGLYLEGAKFTSEDQIAVGDEVVIRGVLCDYNGTAELKQGNYLVSIEHNGLAPADISWSAAQFNAYEGQENEFPTLDNPHELLVTYTSSNEDVATILDGIVSIWGLGTTVITAEFPGDENYLPATVSYTLNVCDPNEIVHVLNATVFEVSGTSYNTYTYTIDGVTYSSINSLNNGNLQYNTNSSRKSGLAVTANDDNLVLKSIVMNCAGSGKNMQVYSSDAAYADVEALFSDETAGALLDTLTFTADSEVSYSPTDDYNFFGMKPAAGGVTYVSEFVVTWTRAAAPVEYPETLQVRVAAMVGTEGASDPVEGVNGTYSFSDVTLSPWVEGNAWVSFYGSDNSVWVSPVSSVVVESEQTYDVVDDGEMGYNFLVPAGVYNIVVDLEAANVTFVKTADVETIDAIYLMGVDGNWSTPVKVEATVGWMGVPEFDFTLSSTTQKFKISTNDGMVDGSFDWNAYNAGAYTFTLSRETLIDNLYDGLYSQDGELVAGDADIALPWSAEWNFYVYIKSPMGDYFYVETADAPETTLDAELYLLGTCNGWTADDDYKFTTEDNVVFTLASVELEEGAEFKVAASDWKPEFGGPTGIAFNTTTTVVQNGGNMTLAGAFKGKVVFDYANMTILFDNRTGLDTLDTEAEAVAPEYFNLQGIRVNNPKGIVIERRGAEVRKVVR